jgi:MFS superfamily sulfate permease-like transporter
MQGIQQSKRTTTHFLTWPSVLFLLASAQDYPEAIYLYKVHKFDFAVWVIAFLGTLFLGVQTGLTIAVGISLFLVIWESAYPHIAELGRLPGTTMYRNVKQYEGACVEFVAVTHLSSLFLRPPYHLSRLVMSDAERYDDVVIVRVDAPIYFANAANVRDEIRKYKRQSQEELQQTDPNMKVQFIILDMSPMSRVDTTGLHMLEDMNMTQKGLQTQLCICNPSIEVTDRLLMSGLADKLGRQHIFSSFVDAVQWCLNDMDTRAATAQDI